MQEAYAEFSQIFPWQDNTTVPPEISACAYKQQQAQANLLKDLILENVA